MPQDCAACILVHSRKTLQETSCSVLILAYLQDTSSGGSRGHHRPAHHPMHPLPFNSCLLNPSSSVYQEVEFTSDLPVFPETHMSLVQQDPIFLYGT